MEVCTFFTKSKKENIEERKDREMLTLTKKYGFCQDGANTRAWMAIRIRYVKVSWLVCV